jgi:DNA polymerase-4
VIRRTAGLCLKRVPLDKKLRLLGVRVAALQPVASLAQQVPAQGQADTVAQGRKARQADTHTAPLFEL